MELRLNVRAPTDEKAGDNLGRAVERKKAHTETMDEAWTRIFEMKNSAPDQRRLHAVKKAMEEGVIGREKESQGKRFSKAEALRLHRELVEIERKDTLRKLVDSTPDNYILAETYADLEAMISDIESSELIAFDLETYSNKKGGALDPWTGKIAGFSVTANDNNYYVPLNHTEMPSEFGDDKTVVEYVKPALESAKTVMHNAPFDCKWFY